MAKVFVSYSHKQGAWVWDRLVPVLRAGDAEVLIDKERFQAGVAVAGQMDKTQDRADVHLLCLSTDYLASAACRSEMERAIGCDPQFTRALDPRVKRGAVVPIRLDAAPLPAAIADPDPLWADMRDDTKAEPWRLLLDRCDADLGLAAPIWLAARDDIVRYLKRGQSLNLLVRRDGIRWRPLITDIQENYVADLGWVDLLDPRTSTRDGLLNNILSQLGAREKVRQPPNDLADFARILSAMPALVRLSVGHFDLASNRKRYGLDFYSCLRWLTMETRKLVLLVESRTPFEALLPDDNPLSCIDIKEVALG